MKVILASPRGFCAGVNMGLESLDLAIQALGVPIYMYHEIIHNQHVVEDYREKGVVFVDDLNDVPEGSTVLFSLHGVSPDVRRLARQRQLHAIDVTCPMVTKVHLEAIHFANQGYKIIFIGHEDHDEALGTMGEAPDDMVLVETEEDVDKLDLPPDVKVAYLTQTTTSVERAKRMIARLRSRFPQIVGPRKEDICFATRNRQDALRVLAAEADIVFVLGSQNSSNSQRLKELAIEQNVPSYLIDGVADIHPDWLQRAETVVITAGASAPESDVLDCVEFLQDRFEATVEERIIREERTGFPLPKELRPLAAQF